MNAFECLDQHAPLFAEARGDIAVSFEFFPPKTETMAETLWASIQTLAPLEPRFVSVTYGAGGSTRERTHATVERILKETALTPAAHLTCVGATREEVDSVARDYWDAGVRNIVALRGDPPEAGARFAPHPGRLCQCGRARRRPEAGRAVRHFGRRLPRNPSGFAEPRTPISTISSARSTPAPTARSPNSSSPRIASSASGTRPRPPGSTSRSCPASCRCPTSRPPAASPRSCGAAIPGWLDDLFEGLDDLPAARQLIAATVAAELCGQLYAGGVRHFHFYTLNRAELSLRDLPPAGREGQSA